MNATVGWSQHKHTLHQAPTCRLHKELQPSLPKLPMHVESCTIFVLCLRFLTSWRQENPFVCILTLRIMSLVRIWIKQTYEKHFSFSCTSFLLVGQKPSISINHKFSNYAIRTTRLNISPSDGSTCWVDLIDLLTILLLKVQYSRALINLSLSWHFLPLSV